MPSPGRSATAERPRTSSRPSASEKIMGNP
jgi:hypothetical protein